MIVSRAVVAQVLVISPRHVSRLVADGTLPRPKRRGEYDLLECTRAYFAYLRHQQLPAENSELLEARAKLMEAKAKALVFKNRQRASTTVIAEEVQATWSSLVEIMSSRLSAIPDNCASLAVDKPVAEVVAIMRREVYAALNDLAKVMHDQADEPR